MISPKNKLNCVILASGTGSNARAIIEYVQSAENSGHDCPWDIQGIVCDQPKAGVLEVADKAGIKTAIVEFSNERAVPLAERRKDFCELLVHAVEDLAPDVDYILCAGFMRILNKSFLAKYLDARFGVYKVINIHPALLPSFAGINGYEDAFNYGVKISGVTTHFVDEKVDHGPIIRQAVFERYSYDTLDRFKLRGLSVEHFVYVQTLKDLQNNKIQIQKQTDGRIFVEINEEEQ